MASVAKLLNRNPAIGTFLLGGVLLLLLALPLAIVAQSVSPTEAMQVANQKYEAGQYGEAIEIYQSIVDAGVQDSTLFYNLGNAYYKQGDLGRAILNYRRAQLLSPRDGDVSANLAIARSQTLDQLGTDRGLLTNFVQIAEEWLTLNEASVLALILWLLISGLVVVAIVLKPLRRASLWAAAVLGFFLVLGLASIANRYYLQSTAPPAVIVAGEVDVTSGPGSAEQYLVEFNLHAGAEVRLLERRPGWRRVALPGNNFQGWVPANAVEPVLVDGG